MATRVAINGFGRTGRCTFRAAYERNADLEVVAVNDLADAGTLGHLLKHDSVFGRFPGELAIEGDRLVVDGRETVVLAEPDPGKLPWGELGVDVVIESSGRFRTREGAGAHLSAGARKVIVSAPAKDPDVTVALGVNFDHVYESERHHIISNASCTTNCLAPVAKILHDDFGIRHGLMTTVHAYTADQMLQDGPHKDLRRARAAAVNMIPTSTGAAKALGLVVPELEGRLHGYALRVPIPTGSVVDLTVELEGPTTVDAINYAFERRASSGPLQGILAYSDEPLVSSDIVKSPYSAVFDSGFTSVIDGTCVKVLAWYDNEWGYANRLSELAERVLAPVLSSSR
jgi:glyceraldehyde 3-phosphate dehydrogenase